MARGLNNFTPITRHHPTGRCGNRQQHRAPLALSINEIGTIINLLTVYQSNASKKEEVIVKEEMRQGKKNMVHAATGEWLLLHPVGFASTKGLMNLAICQLEIVRVHAAMLELLISRAP